MDIFFQHGLPPVTLIMIAAHRTIHTYIHAYMHTYMNGIYMQDI